jgi:hypothetical protein
MFAKSIVILILCIILFSISVNGYRLDSDRHLNDVDDPNELNDPYLIKRIQMLLGTSKQRNNDLEDYSASDHSIDRRLISNRRPGLIRLK